MIGDIIHAEGVRFAVPSSRRRRVTCSAHALRRLSRSASRSARRPSSPVTCPAANGIAQRQKPTRPSVVLGHSCRAKYGNFSRAPKGNDFRGPTGQCVSDRIAGRQRTRLQAQSLPLQPAEPLGRWQSMDRLIVGRFAKSRSRPWQPPPEIRQLASTGLPPGEPRNPRRSSVRRVSAAGAPGPNLRSRNRSSWRR